MGQRDEVRRVRTDDHKTGTGGFENRPLTVEVSGLFPAARMSVHREESREESHGSVHFGRGQIHNGNG